ncbi:helix-turn-helix domain-containing protein [Streptomyces sp. NBC_00523]|uniref:helix-turn-helix domain-containing protein n=1 Tax=Streptomyces sp. NBC_00523 TaxID=2975765 RepID=UPI002E811F64|nr:helix-turn-helix domain-containing protein [Streptomyces sp. NBC_00523]WUD04075.1 helix-turn-helix domain-containing protein [Streptomyces sp. NBC_00523]
MSRDGGGERERGTNRGRGVTEGAFALLDALRRCGGEAGLTDIAAACALPKGSAHRLLEQLLLVGAVERRGSRYRVGSQLYRLGQVWEPHPGLRVAARHPLHRLRAVTGASALLTVLHDGRALTVASVPGEVEPLVPVRNGMSFLLDTAAGQVLSARGGAGSGGRLAGAVLECSEVMDGVCCAALPVRGRDERTIAAIAVMTLSAQGLQRAAHEAALAAAAVTAALARAGTPSPCLPPVLHY